MRLSLHPMVLSAFFCACAAAGPQLERGDFSFEYPSGNETTSVRCRPMQWLDNTFALSEGDPSVIVFTFAQTSKEPPTDPHLMVALPEQVRVTAMHSTLNLEKTVPWEAGRALHDFRLPKTGYASSDDDAEGPGVSILVETGAAAGAVLPEMVFWFRDGAKESPRSAMRLRVLHAVRGRTPKSFSVGIMPRKPTAYLRGDGAGGWGEFVKRTGVGWIIGAANTPTTLSCVKAGLDVACESGLANGYMLGWGMHPEDVAFYLPTGERMKRALCPTAIYTRHPYVEENLYRKIVRALIAESRTCNSLTTNWEPYMFLGKGCFCPRCRDEFTRWSKLRADEVRKDWPLGVVKKHKARYEEFFAWQHGQVLIALEKMCREAGKLAGVESHFVPQVAYTIFDPDKKNDYYHRMTDVEKYADEVRWIQPWGGYVTWSITDPGRRPPVGARLRLNEAAAMARQWAEAHVRDGAPPRLSWGHGTYMGTTACTFPEGVAFDILCCFLNGMDRTAAYVFPMGYDNRYWAAMSEAADAAAEFEDFVRGGKRTARHVVEARSPIPSVEGGPLLRSFEFEKYGRRLIAVGNFWEESEAFFLLKVQGVAADARLALREPREDRRFMSPSGKPYWTSAELADGVLAHVGRLRWAFFTLDPDPGTASRGILLSQADVADALKKRTALLERDCAVAVKRIADARTAETGEAGDYAKLKPLQLDGLRCVINDLDGDGKPEVVYTRAGEELAVELAKGARVLSWKLDGFDVVHPLAAHALAVDATWAPAAFVDGEVKVLEHAVVPGGMRLTTERTIPKAARGSLPGVKVQRTLFVPSEGGAFRVTTRLTNTGDDVKEFAYRQTTTPTALTRVTGGEGWVQLWGEKGPFTFKRNFLKSRYHLAGQPRVERLDGYAMDVSGVVTEPRVRFGCSWSPVEIEARVEDGKLYAFVFWDSGGQEASTAEFICQNLKLKPGQSWDVSVDWRKVTRQQ